MRKSRQVIINGRIFKSISQACKYWKITPVTMYRWIRKNGNSFRQADLEITVCE